MNTARIFLAQHKIFEIDLPDYINISKQELDLCNASDKPEQIFLNLVIQRLACHFSQCGNNEKIR
jgi:hypothetical protein